MPPVGVLLEVAAAGGAAGLVLLATFPWRERAWPAPVAVAVGYAVSDFLARGAPELIPLDASRFLFHVAVAAGVFGVVESAPRVPPAPRWILRAAASGAMAWLLLHGIPAPGWKEMAVSSGVAFALWAAMALHTPKTRPIAIMVAAGGGGAALAASHTALVGQLAGAAAAALGAVVAMRMLFRGPGRATSLAPLGALLLPAFWICGHFLADLPLRSAVLLAAAPLLAFGPWWLGGLLPAIPTGVAVYLAYAANPAQDYGY